MSYHNNNNPKPNGKKNDSEDFERKKSDPKNGSDPGNQGDPGKEKGKPKDDRRDRGRTPHSNPIETWVPKANEVLAKAAANIPFTYANGIQVPLGEESKPVAGIWINYFTPTFGVSSDMNSPINVAAIDAYTFVRHMNSGATNKYTAPDLMIAQCAYAEALTWLMVGKRAYGCMRKYDIENKYIPRALVQACGFDYDELARNMADFRASLLMYTSKLMAFAMPKSFKLFSRRLELVVPIIRESANQKTQFYVSLPDSYYTYNQTASQTGGKLEQHFAPFRERRTISLSEYYAIMDNIYDALRNSQDFATMSGDIKKAYGDENLVKLGGFDENYDTPIIEDQVWLEQIANSRCVGGRVFAELTQENNVLKFEPKVDSSIYPRSEDKNWVLNFHRKAGWEEVVEATRLLFTVGEKDIDTGYHAVTSCGTEIFSMFRILTFTNAGQINEVGWHLLSDGYDPSFLVTTFFGTELYYGYDYGAQTSGKVNLSQLVNYVTPFNHHPIIYCFDGEAGNIPGELIGRDLNAVFVEYDNYAVISTINIKNINDVALLGVFNCPRIAAKDNVS